MRKPGPLSEPPPHIPPIPPHYNTYRVALLVYRLAKSCCLRSYKAPAPGLIPHMACGNVSVPMEDAVIRSHVLWSPRTECPIEERPGQHMRFRGLDQGRLPLGLPLTWGWYFISWRWQGRGARKAKFKGTLHRRQDSLTFLGGVGGIGGFGGLHALGQQLSMPPNLHNPAPNHGGCTPSSSHSVPQSHHTRPSQDHVSPHTAGGFQPTPYSTCAL